MILSSKMEIITNMSAHQTNVRKLEKKHHQHIQGKEISMKHMNFLLKMKADLRAQQVAEVMKKGIDSFASDVKNFHHFMLLMS